MKPALFFLASASAFAVALPGSAEAQDAPAQPAPSSTQGRTTVYDAAFFAQYSPRTALDIARRVPGFSLDLGNQDVRGFAQAAGNVVINGARPSSKAETLEATLNRIPANSVVRVEVGPGDLYGAEYSTKSQVANVILSEAGGIDGTFTGSIDRLYTGKLTPDGSVSALIRRGASTINLSGGFGNVLNHEEGTDTQTDPDTGDVIEFRRKFNSYHDFNPYLSASWALERADDNAIRANVRWSPGQFDLFQRNHVVPAIGPERDDDLVQDFDNPVFELGGDVTRPLARGAIKLVGLATRRKRDYSETYRFRGEGGDPILGGAQQLQKAQRNESILRLSWTRADLLGVSFETGVEGAINTLDHHVDFFDILPGGEQVRRDLGLDNAQVKENRAEGYVRAGKQLSSALRLDAGLNYEYSDLTVTGDADAHRKLKFLKPSVTLDWKNKSGLHGQVSVRRTVAQLNFYDFISAAELSADRVNGGNANLQPQRAWEFRATVEKPVLNDGLVKLDLGYDHISMLQDRILICDELLQCFDAPGNLGTGKRAFANLTVDAPLTFLGLKGARLKFTGNVQRTRVEDPISGEMRNFSDYYPDWEWTVDYRHDIGAFSYGFTVQDRDRFTFFRTDEFDSNWNEGPYGTAFVEYRPGPRTAVTFDVDNLFSTQNLRNRLLFDPNRAFPERIINELRERNRHPRFGLTLKQTFGGAGTRTAAASATPQG